MFIITGGGTGIGRALAHELANRSQKTLIIGRHKEKLEETASYSNLIDICCADVTKQADLQIIFNKLQNIKNISGLIHNAGIIQPITKIDNIDINAWQQVLNTNLTTPLVFTQLLLKKLQHGRVLTIGSGAAYFPIVGWSAYCVSKAGLSMLMRCWQLEFKDSATAFANVMPGIIDTDMQAFIRHAQYMDTEKIEFFNQLFINKKLISPETVAQFLCWLLLSISSTEYSAQEWDIYDSGHHQHWLKPPYFIAKLESAS